MAYNMRMVIKETAIFTRQIGEVLDLESYRLLQLHLLHRPDAGSLIRGSGGIRKIRWAPSGTGKRGGARLLYYWAVDAETILMLVAFSKADMKDLSQVQIKRLAALVKEEFS